MPDAGGAYIPPYRLAQLQKQTEDKSTEEFQKLTWEALKKSINGLVNKVAISNIAYIIPEVFSENLVRGRGLFCRSLMKAQMASPSYSHVYAALVSIVNTKMPELGELLLSRVVLQVRASCHRIRPSRVPKKCVGRVATVTLLQLGSSRDGWCDACSSYLLSCIFVRSSAARTAAMTSQSARRW